MAATTAAMSVENWDDDADFQGDFHAFASNSHGSNAPSQPSRLSSVRSESLAGDEDWNVTIQPNDEHSTTQAIQSAKQAGIPLPSNVPTSALLGGTIKRLGKKKSRAKLVEDDWGADLEMSEAPLQLKPRTDAFSVTSGDDFGDDFDDLEGSLGIRFAGTKRDARNRSSSTSMMSPSLDSIAADSELDNLDGLELPEGSMDLEAILKKRRAADADLSDISQPSPAIEQPATMNVHKKSRLLTEDSDNFLEDFDLGGTHDILDVRKRKLNKNLQVKPTKPTTPSSRPATTLNFHDKPTDKPVYNRSHIPRPVSGIKSSRLESVPESGNPSVSTQRRQPTTTSAQLLRAKRSMPVLRNTPSINSFNKPTAPFLPAGVSSFQSPHAATQRTMPMHLRRDSDNFRNGAISPPMRSHSRLSNQLAPDTPSRSSRQRADMAPAALAREAAAKRTLTRPSRRRNFGDGSELEIFDDLPTSLQKESKFTKQPLARGPPRPGLRQTQSRSDIRDLPKRQFAMPDRMMTPAPQTPVSPTKGFYDNTPSASATPSYLRDTAASRIARESRLASNPRPRSEGPLQPLSTNWKAQVAARSPHTSPHAQRLRRTTKRPALISGIGSHGIAKSEKGMVYNPQTLRWEGNENTLAQFERDVPPAAETPTPSSYQNNLHHHLHHHSSHQHLPPALDDIPLKSASPSRPALITKIPTSSATGHGGGSGHAVQVQNGMVYDPQQMKWLKWKGGRDASGQLSPSVTDGDTDEEDPFAGIEDLRDENHPAPSALGGAGGDASAAAVAGMASPVSLAAAGVGEVHEEFDMGPRFIQSQRDEEAAWRKRCAAWFTDDQPRVDDGRWRRAIREIVPFEATAAAVVTDAATVPLPPPGVSSATDAGGDFGEL